jgi:hypothetical protein
MNERTNERTNERKKEITIKQASKRMDKQTTYIYIERLKELTPARARVMYVYMLKF